MKHLKELKDLKLPKDEYAVFGSGPMAIRGLRENKDIDIIVKGRLWKRLSGKYEVKIKNEGRIEYIQIGNIEIFKDWKPWFEDIDVLIDSADIIDGIRFVGLEYILEWKSAMGRDKDKKDVKMILKYLKDTDS